jgi:hypothetical protein
MRCAVLGPFEAGVADIERQKSHKQRKVWAHYRQALGMVYS